MKNRKLNDEIKTERLTLRPFRLEDKDDVFTYAKVDGVGQMCGWKPHETIADTLEWLTKVIPEREDLAIVYDGHVIGAVAAGTPDMSKSHFAPFKSRVCLTMGAVLSKDYWGQGICTEALSALIEWIFTNTDIDTLFAAHYDFNTRSAGMQKKCGFRKIGERDEFVEVWGREIHVIQNMLTKEAWLDERWERIIAEKCEN